MNEILNIESIDHLYKLIDDNLIQRYNTFAVFRDYMNSYYNGCECTKKTFLKLSTIEYNKIIINEEAINVLKQYLNYTNITFSEMID